MYVSRLCFHTFPGKTHQLEAELHVLADLARQAGGGSPRVLRTHFASLGSPDIVFEQEADDLTALEHQIDSVTSQQEFREWSDRVSSLLREPPKREVYSANGSGG